MSLLAILHFLTAPIAARTAGRRQHTPPSAIPLSVAAARPANRIRTFAERVIFWLEPNRDGHFLLVGRNLWTRRPQSVSAT